jgi:hypothetical protein
MKMLHATVYQKIVLVTSFILFGLVLGVLGAWFDRRYDQWFPLNVPGDFVDNFGFLGGHILSSVLVWAVLGALLAFLFKPKIIAWIMGVYLVVFGGLWLGWEAMHW